MLKILIMIVCLFIAGESIAAENDCYLYNSEYVPFDQNEAPKKGLKFKLTFEEAEFDTTAADRNIILNFEAYDGVTNQKLSIMRFSDVWSSGISRRYFSNYWGQFASPNDLDNWTNFKSGASFQIIGIDESLSPKGLENTPELLVFPQTFLEIRNNSQRHPQDWDNYIRFLTDERVYPDFGGHDFWVRSKCGQPPIEYKTELSCDGAQSQIVTFCHPEETRKGECHKQIWDYGHIKPQLNTIAKNLIAHKWACLKPQTEKKDYKDEAVIIFYFANSGNCETCERLEIWNLYGTKLADWREFEEKYKELKLPDVQGDKFHKQFKPINKGH